MLKYLIWIITFICIQEFAFADFEKELQPISIIDHPVSTTNPEVQKYFNKGLTQIFAFNHDLAFFEFENASKLDPSLAMAYWGMALALGQNINQDVTPENEIKAYQYIQKALSFISKASPNEQAYIKALAVRYTNDPKQDLVPLRAIYCDAMKRLVEHYPEDLDAACLYAESILDINPWKYWSWDGKPLEGTLEVIDLLQSILTRDPYHMGANHFFIHAWEESLTPERALISAFRLTSLFMGGHLLHMPCHIFMLCGYYENAIQTSKKAIAADQEYINKYGMGGEYPLHYLTHNFKVLVRAYMLSEDYENAIKAVAELNQFLAPHYLQHPHLANALIIPIEVDLYFHRWNHLLDLPLPIIKDPFVYAYWHLSCAMAQINLGDWKAYQKEKNLIKGYKQKIAPQAEIANNPSVHIIELGELLLEAEEARFQKDQTKYIERLKIAVDKQDRLDYDEPPPWYMPIRTILGKALLENRLYSVAEGVFRKGLCEYQRNGRLLFGLYLSLKAQGKDWDAFWVEREMKKSLKNATEPLTQEIL